jgi:hypothetical protein
VSNEHYNITEDGLITTVPTQEQIERYEEIVVGYPRTKRGIGWNQCTVTQIDDAVLALKGVRVLAVDGESHSRLLISCACPAHGRSGYSKPVLLNNLLARTRGNLCSLCKAECMARQVVNTFGDKAAAFVGQTTKDGHVVLEHIGYHRSPCHIRTGELGDTKYRYRCFVCGSEDGIALGKALQRQNHTTHCGCLSTRDSRLTFSKSEAKATAPCFVYVYSVLNNSGIKVGIAKNVQARASKSYEQQLFVSQAMPRANAWAVEQVLLFKLRSMGLQYDLAGTDAFQGKEAGGSEVFHQTDLTAVIQQINDLISEAETIGWQQILDRYIPIDKMTHHQLFYWDGDRMRQSSGEGYIGFDFIQQFASLQEVLSQ